MNFKNALIMAFQCGGEKVTEINETVKVSRKSGFDAILGKDTKDDIVAHSKASNWDEFSQNEKNALLFAYCQGWNVEAEEHNSNLY